MEIIPTCQYNNLHWAVLVSMNASDYSWEETGFVDQGIYVMQLSSPRKIWDTRLKYAYQ